MSRWDDIEPGPVPLCRVSKYLPIDSIKPHPNNPRTITSERMDDLMYSIATKGIYQPWLVWKKDSIALSGNHRLEAVKRLRKKGFTFTSPNGEENVLPVVVENVSDEVAEQILYESNTNYADWIEEKLQAALKEAEANGADIRDYGFTQEKLDAMLISAEKEAEESIKSSDAERKIEPVSEHDVKKILGEDEEFESLILPREVYDQTMELLGEIALKINPDWTLGDSIVLPMQALIQVVRANGIVDKIKL